MPNNRAERGTFHIRSRQSSDMLEVSFSRRGGGNVTNLTVRRGDRRLYHDRARADVVSALRSISLLQADGNPFILERCSHALGVIGQMLGIDVD